MKRRTVLYTFGAGMTCAALNPAGAQTAWPNRPIRLIIPSSAGSAPDILGRLIGERLHKSLGQPVVVDNRPGALGRIATGAALAAAPDGHTLLLSYGSAVVGPRVLFPKDKNDATKLQPIARFGSQGALIVVTPDVPARNIKEFGEWVRASKEPIGYATYGIGSGGHIVMEALIKVLGIKLDHFPYKDGGQIIPNMRSGLVHVGALDAVSPIPYIKNKQLFAIGVNGRKRLPATPEVPTLAEQGIPIFMESWYGIFAPKGTPRAIVDRLNAEIGSIVSSPVMMERFEQMNLANTPRISPEEFGQFINSEVKVWGDVVAASNIRLD